VRTVTIQDVLEAHVESGVRVRGKSIAILAIYILGPAIIVAHRITDLNAGQVSRDLHML
jgi:hypothetical protein